MCENSLIFLQLEAQKLLVKVQFSALSWCLAMQANSLAIPCLAHQHLCRPWQAWHTSQSRVCLCWVTPHGNGTAGVSLGQTIPSCCGLTEVSWQQSVTPKWFILTKSVRVAVCPPFSKDPAACRGRPPSEFNHWHPASLQSLCEQHASYTSSGRCHLFPNPLEIRGAQVFSSWPNAELLLSTKTGSTEDDLQKVNGLLYGKYLGKTSFTDY